MTAVLVDAEQQLEELQLTAEELADMDGVTFETIWVTPVIARKFLGDMIEHNRSVKKGKLKSFTNDMRRGRWRLNGDTLRFNRSGKLIDGRHRLQALIDSGVAGLPMTIVRGIDDEAITTIDTGSARSLADVLHMRANGDYLANVNKNVLAATVRRVYHYDRGNPLMASNVIAAPSHDELWDFYRTDPSGFRSATARGEDLRRGNIGNSTVGSTMYYLLRRNFPDPAFEFFDQLITGADLSLTHPILKLRDRLKDGGPSRGAPDKPTEQMILYIRTWNAWRQDRPIKALIVSGAVEITNKNFPKPL